MLRRDVIADPAHDLRSTFAITPLYCARSTGDRPPSRILSIPILSVRGDETSRIRRIDSLTFPDYGPEASKMPQFPPGVVDCACYVT